MTKKYNLNTTFSLSKKNPARGDRTGTEISAAQLQTHTHTQRTFTENRRYVKNFKQKKKNKQDKTDRQLSLVCVCFL